MHGEVVQANRGIRSDGFHNEHMGGEGSEKAVIDGPW